MAHSFCPVHGENDSNDGCPVVDAAGKRCGLGPGDTLRVQTPLPKDPERYMDALRTLMEEFRVSWGPQTWNQHPFLPPPRPPQVVHEATVRPLPMALCMDYERLWRTLRRKVREGGHKEILDWMVAMEDGQVSG